MKEKTKYLIIAVAILLVVGIGISFAYFMANVNQTGEGSSTSGTTVTLKDTVVKVDGNITFNDLDIYPGHQNVSSIKVTATGDQKALYNLIWEGENTLNTSLKYYVYKTTVEENPSISCEKKEEGTLTKKYYEVCEESGFENLGSIVASGEIGTTKSETKFKLIKNEEIQGTEEGSQNIDIGGHFNGTVYIELLEEKETTLLKEAILANSKVNEGEPDFSQVATTDEGVFKTQDDWGESYYFRGAVNNNWVSFAGFYWRIIRINGDGSIRMIYNGTGTATTGESTQISASSYNSSYNDNAYVGYMYGSTGANSYAATHANNNNSTIKGVLDSWYAVNIANKGYGDKVSTEVGFCNDRRIAGANETFWNSDTKKGYGTNTTAYVPFSRFLTTGGSWASTQKPTLKCSQLSSDMFTPTGSSKGNKKLTSPVGLITADEVVYAGGKGETNNTSYYLYTGQNYWTMSSSSFYGGYAFVFRVNSGGQLAHDWVNGTSGVRPVINLAYDVEITGSGTSSDPYVVV